MGYNVYSYNGIELPELPARDETVYPYAFICRAGISVETGYTLCFCSELYPHEKKVYDTQYVEYCTPLGAPGQRYYYVNDTDPVVWAGPADEHYDQFPLYGGSSESGELTDNSVVWANSVIYNPDGSVRLAGSSPTFVRYVETEDDEDDEDDGVQLYSWLIGFLIGLIQKPALTFDAPPAQEPVAYLYNGVRLPKLPEWDRGEYPYAYIAVSSGGGYGFCYRTTAKTVSDGGHAGIDLTFDGAWFLLSDDNTKWESYSAKILGTVVWANYDVYYSETAGGTLYMESSDPVPIYE